MLHEIVGTDVECQKAPDGTWRVATSARVFRLRGEGLDSLFGALVPGLRRDGEQSGRLSHVPSVLESHAPKLREMGVLLPVPETCAPLLADENDAALFTYLARATGSPEKSFLRLKTQRVEVFGPPRLCDPLATALRPLFGNVRLGDELPTDLPCGYGDSTLLVVAALEKDEPSLHASNGRFVREGLCWVPVLFRARRVEIGPFYYPGQTACLACVYDTKAATHDTKAVNHDTKAVNHDTKAAAEPAESVTAWRSLRPHLLQWAGSLLAANLEACMTPVTQGTPWSKRIELDFDSLRQQTVHVWRRPGCRTCSSPSAVPQRWVET